MPTCQRQTTLSLCRRVEYSGGGGDILYPSTHSGCCWGSTFPNDWPNTKGSSAAATTRSEGCCGCGRCVGYVKADKETTERSKCFRPPIFFPFRSSGVVSNSKSRLRIDCAHAHRVDSGGKVFLSDIKFPSSRPKKKEKIFFSPLLLFL